jgi:hypothetical protein
MSYQHSSNISCNIMYIVKNFKIIYFTHVIFILNYIFTVVFYSMR